MKGLDGQGSPYRRARPRWLARPLLPMIALSMGLASSNSFYMGRGIAQAAPPGGSGAIPTAPELGPAAPSEWMTLPVATIYTLPPGGGPTTVRAVVSMKHAGMQIRDVDLDLLDVGLGSRHDSQLKAHFGPLSLERRAGYSSASPKLKEGSTATLLVPVKFSDATAKPQPLEPLPQGTYDLRISVRNRKQPQAAEQILSLQIIRPPAALRTPTKLIIEQPQFFGTASGGASPRSFTEQGVVLRIGESSGNSNVTDLKFSIQEAAGSSQAGAAAVTFPTPPTSIAPGQQVEVPCVLRGDFPLGTTAGTIEIRAPQLADAVLVPFEVRAFRPKWLLVLLAFAGAGVGYLMRHSLKEQVELNELLLKGLNLEERLKQERDRRDEDFRGEIDAAQKDLVLALRAKSTAAASITTAIESAQGTLSKALEALATRRAQAQESFKKLAVLTATQWLLPSAVTSAIEQAKGSREEARLLLTKDDVGGAVQKMKETELDIRASLDPWRQWLPTAHELLSELMDNMPASAAEKARLRVDSLRKLLEQAEKQLSERGGDAEAAVALDVELQTVDAAQRQLRALVPLLARWLGDVATEVARSLRAADPPHKEVVEQLQEAVAEAAARLASRPAQPLESVLQQFVEDIKALRPQWNNTLVRQLTNAEDIQELLDQRRYQEAALKVTELLKREHEDEDRMLGPNDTNSKDAGPAPGAALPDVGTLGKEPALTQDGEAPAVPLLHFEFTRARDIEPTEGVRQRAGAELARAKALRFLVSFLGIAYLGLQTFADGFVGTVPQMATVFFWAFGIDVSVDILVQASQAAGTPKP